MTGEQQRSLSGNFELTVVLTDKRQLRMTGYVYSDDTAVEINKRIDQFQDTLDRQSVRCDVASKEAEIAQTDAAIAELADHHEALTTLKDAKALTSQQKQQLAQYESSARFFKKKKDSLKAAITEGRKKLNGAA